ncbi:formylglycine-generating enzyme family protein [Candidatus Parabeggiatoa sp. HSG14]|uniref:formylglycine-generating enzyme family protein n=1 Tax=Candidatus Parabeggiatoa sp. HSG14 TaxID=3055593 RepID=UPI0025A7480C|nr:formylglycine-generating enzyme family protein [Thiotrichales bacterium HSG14]
MKLNLIRAIIATIIGGFIVGNVLLWLEYNIFLPRYDLPRNIPTSTKSTFSCTAGKIFRNHLKDGSLGPEMVVISAGQFWIGGIQDVDADRKQSVHKVAVSNFAIGRYEVTFAEYDHFTEATSRKKPNDEAWGRGNRPVINVSWKDAMVYTEWLSQQTEQHYRLPTESEWEYAAQAGTNSPYWWGSQIGANLANCDGCGSRWDNKKTAPIGSFGANPFKLYDTIGNVYEWTCSEYEEKYNGKEQHCLTKDNVNSLRVVRGGSWYSLPRYVRVTSRFRNRPNNRDLTVGFRVVRECSTLLF